MRQTIAIEVDGERFEARVVGPDAGPVALLLHGFPDLPESWLPVAEHLAEAGWRCVLPWMRGYPPSTVAGPFDLDRIARDVRGLAAAVSPDAPVLALGHDWGAAALWLAALDAPERFSAIVTAAVPFPTRFVGRGLLSPRQVWRSRYMFAFQVGTTDRAGLERLWRRWSPGLEPPPDHLDRVAAAIRASGDAPVRYYRAAFRSPAIWRRFFDRRRIRVPVLYLHGRDDGCIAAWLCRGQARHIDAPYRAELVDHAGHFLQLEQPARIAELVLDFIDR